MSPQCSRFGTNMHEILNYFCGIMEFLLSILITMIKKSQEFNQILLAKFPWKTS